MRKPRRMRNRALAQLLAEFKSETGESLPLLEKNLLSSEAKAATERERYANDPEHRAHKKASARQWNKANPERKRRNDNRWAKKHGAAAARRYRARKKAQVSK